MHSIEELGTNVPAFLAKLWKMVEDSGTNDLICWSPNGTSFFIRDQAKFARELLPLYYKHNNMASFVRQLNMYGFHKVVSIESGGLKIDRDDMEFAHQYFLMGHPFLLEHIKRKIPTNKSEDGRAGTKPELVNKVLSEVKSLKGRQDSVDSQLSAMKRENEVLWREVAILRQKHLKQQQIVNKLIQFLVSMVQTSRGGGIGIKRHYPLMLSDITHHSNKNTSKANGNISDVNSVPSNSSPTGPVIHELDPAELLEDCAPAMEDEASVPVFDLCDPVSTTETSDDLPSTSPGVASNLTTSAADVSSVLTDPAVADNVTVVNGTILNDAASEVLLELVEECPLNDNAMASENSRSLLSTSKPSKGKQKSSVLKGNKRRKSKPTPSNIKTAQLVTIKTEGTDSEEPVNVNNFLEIMLPSLANDSPNTEKLQESSGAASSCDGEIILPDFDVDPLQTEANEKTNEQSSLEAATDAAISAISNVAAQAAAAATTNGFKVGTDASNNAASKTGDKTLLEENGTTTNKDLTLACAGSDAYKCKEDLDVHLENMQSELDSLKELLKGEGYSLDANMLLGVCAAGLGIDANTVKLFGDDSISYGLPLAQEENSVKGPKENGVSDPMVSGNELMTYSSNLFDLADMPGFDDNWNLPADNFNGEANDDLNTPLVSIGSPGFSGIPAKKKKLTK